MASGDFRYLRTVFRAMPSSPAIPRMERPAPFIPRSLSLVPPSTKSVEHLQEDFVNDAPAIGWVNSTPAISLIFSSAITPAAVARPKGLLHHSCSARPTADSVLRPAELAPPAEGGVRRQLFLPALCATEKCHRTLGTRGAIPQRETPPLNRGNLSNAPSASSSANSCRSAAWPYCASAYPSGSMAW